jgi:hypothetical protein
MAFEKKDAVWLGLLGVLIVVAVVLLLTGKLEFVQNPTTAYTFKATVCSDHYSGNCTPGTNVCTAGSNCNITFSINTSTSGVNVFLNGTAMSSEFICVPKNASNAVAWNSIVSGTTPTNFVVDFGNAVPFLTSTSNVITGSSNAPAVTTSTPNVDACYKYDVKVCNNVTAPSGAPITCGEYDPKVIVGNP